MIALVPIICAILGALAYALSANAKVAELGRLLFLASVIALMFAFSAHTVKMF